MSGTYNLGLELLRISGYGFKCSFFKLWDQAWVGSKNDWHGALVQRVSPEFLRHVVVAVERVLEGQVKLVLPTCHQNDVTPWDILTIIIS